MRNLTLLTDLYELTMMQGYFENEDVNKTVIFDMFYRANPEGNGYAICAGLDQLIDYVKNLHFTEADIAYLESLGIFKPAFLDYLRDFRFTGDIYAIPEGTVIFPREPLVKVIAPIMQAQLIETALLNIINHQSLIATKAARIVRAAQGDGVMEFGCRRAQGPDAGIYGARAAMIAGCVGTSNVLCGQIFDVPVSGTHAHSWIMSFPDELSAFRAYAKLYPDACILLIDTYDTLDSGLPHAIQVFKELREKGIHLKRYGIRMDSGDLAYLSKKVKAALDAEGFTDAIISKDCPAFGGVYKLAAIWSEKEQRFLPKIKISENAEKITNPGDKKVYRIYDLQGMIVADLIALADEQFSADEPLLLFDPIETWKKTLLPGGSYRMKELLVPVFEKGSCVYESPKVMDIRQHCKEELATLWEESKRFEYPHQTYVDLSRKLWNVKTGLLEQYQTGVSE